MLVPQQGRQGHSGKIKGPVLCPNWSGILTLSHPHIHLHSHHYGKFICSFGSICLYGQDKHPIFCGAVNVIYCVHLINVWYSIACCTQKWIQKNVCPSFSSNSLNDIQGIRQRICMPIFRDLKPKLCSILNSV